MRPEQLEMVKAKLLEAREAANRRLRRIVESAGFDRSEADWSGELSTYDNHTADSGPSVEMREVNLGLMNHERDTVAQIESALARMEDGTYGKCAHCGRDIPLERLMAIPYAEACAECGTRERGPIGTGTPRPVEEEVIRPPFGGTDQARAFDDPGIHGEDIWDDLAQYGTANSPQDEEVYNAQGPDAF